MMPRSCLSTDVCGTVPFERTSACSNRSVPALLSVCIDAVDVVSLEGMFLGLGVGSGIPANSL